jgi:hypothetical protein
MRLLKTASGKHNLKLSKKEWGDMGKQAGWLQDTKDWVGHQKEYGWGKYKGKSPEEVFYMTIEDAQEQLNTDPYGNKAQAYYQDVVNTARNVTDPQIIEEAGAYISGEVFSALFGLEESPCKILRKSIDHLVPDFLEAMNEEQELPETNDNLETLSQE